MNNTNSTKTGTLFILTAPSGAGKTTLSKALAQTMPDVKISVSYTTRPQRPGEENGVHYWFVGADEFENMAVENVFLEYAEVFGNFYGTSREQVYHYLNAGQDVILAIDWQGARQVQQLFLEDASIFTVSVFILPPSAGLLRHRLKARQQDQITVIEQRLAGASEDVSHYRDFDYIIVNDEFNTALADLQAIVRSGRLRRDKQAAKYQRLLAELLGKM